MLMVTVRRSWWRGPEQQTGRPQPGTGQQVSSGSAPPHSRHSLRPPPGATTIASSSSTTSPAAMSRAATAHRPTPATEATRNTAESITVSSSSSEVT